MRLAIPVLLFALALPGCNVAQVSRWDPIELVAPNEYPDAPAVALLDDVRWEVRMPLGAVGFTRRRIHRTILIKKPEGVAFASFPLDDPSWKVESSRARVTASSGVVREVEPVFSNPTAPNVTRVMQVPGLQVGDVVDWVLEQVGGVLTFQSDRVTMGIPIRHYHAELDIPKRFSAQLKLYNSTASFPFVRGDSSTHARLDLRDVPAATTEPYAPPWPLVDPWWAYRTRSRVRPVQRDISEEKEMLDTWADVLVDVARKLYAPTLTADADLTIPDSETCRRERRCVVDAALVYLRQHAELTGFLIGIGAPRTVHDVLATGQANSVEKAITLHALLEHAGIASHFVLAAREPTRTPDPGFPMPGRFDHVVLMLTPDASGSAQIVDPSCEYCRMGELPSWLEGAGMMELRPKLPGTPDLGFDVELGTVHGDAAMRMESHRAFDAHLAADGSMTGTVAVERRGSLAVEAEVASRGRPQAYWSQKLAAEVRMLGKTIGLAEVHPGPCDRSQARCLVEAHYAVPQYAQLEGDKIIVPLSILSTRSKAPAAARQSDLMVQHALREVESIVLHVPEGYAVGELPAPGHWSTPMLDASFDVRSTPTTVEVTRTLELHKGIWTKEAWAELVSAVKAFSATLQVRIELHRASKGAGRIGATREQAAPPVAIAARP